MTETDGGFGRWLSKWSLIKDGELIATRSSRLLPVLGPNGAALMLKIAMEPEERAGAALMVWRAGQGAAEVVAHEDDALLMQRALGQRSLAHMAGSGEDAEATRILCAAVSALHRPQPTPPDTLVPLETWFASLLDAGRHGGLVARCAAIARDLLDTPRDVVPLHGDIHHGNVLDFGPDGWLAIDPKGLIGERGFDYANLFCNPNHDIAGGAGVLLRRLDIVSAEASVEPARMLRWIIAWAGLSAVWKVEDGKPLEPDLTIAEIAAAALDQWEDGRVR